MFHMIYVYTCEHITVCFCSSDVLTLVRRGVFLMKQAKEGFRAFCSLLEARKLSAGHGELSVNL